MVTLRWIVVLPLAALTASGQQVSSQQALPQAESVPPVSCPVTRRPAHEFIPPAPYKRDDVAFWLGTEKLWTVFGEPGAWQWTPHKPGHEHQPQPLTAKTFWMSVNYDWRKEPNPELTVLGKRLDGSSAPLLVTAATNAFPGPGAAMLVGVYVPTPGAVGRLREIIGATNWVLSFGSKPPSQPSSDRGHCWRNIAISLRIPTLRGSERYRLIASVEHVGDNEWLPYVMHTQSNLCFTVD